MSDLDILREMIKTEAAVEIKEDPYGKKAVTLTEPKGAGHSGYSVTIGGMPKDALVIKTDLFPAPKPVFKNSKGECKRADFVILAATGKRNIIICIEMKKGKGDSEEEIIRQLKGTQCFIAYCREIGRIFWQQPQFLKQETYEYRFVSIRDIGVHKKTSRIPPLSGLHDIPEKMLKINAPHRLQFNNLA